MSDTRFVIPGFRATPEERRLAIARLNTISLTIEQFEEGWDLYERTRQRCMKGELPRDAPMAALEDFCASADLLPADLAAAAIYVRADPIVDALSGAFDMRVEDPENYAGCILDPLGDNALDYPALSTEDIIALEMEDEE